MKTEEIKDLFNKFESIVCDYNGVECWSARELQRLLGYSKWDKFQNVIEKAKNACVNADEDVTNHFPQVEKMVAIGSGAFRPSIDMLLTRYACYLIAQNGDPSPRSAQRYKMTFYVFMVFVSSRDESHVFHRYFEFKVNKWGSGVSPFLIPFHINSLLNIFCEVIRYDHP